jgi:hypothetical protein
VERVCAPAYFKVDVEHTVTMVAFNVAMLWKGLEILWILLCDREVMRERQRESARERGAER